MYFIFLCSTQMWYQNTIHILINIHINSNINYLKKIILILLYTVTPTLANISRPTAELGETFIDRLWEEFIFIVNNIVFLNVKSISVQLLLYTPKFSTDFCGQHKIKEINIINIIIVGKKKFDCFTAVSIWLNP